MQSNKPAFHVAIIMDGNGRWATGRGLPRLAGHRAGVESIRRVIEAAPPFGITTLTLYAFSSDNWGRPKSEVAGLMGLLEHYLEAETVRLAESGVRLTVIGRRDRLPAPIPAAIDRAEAATRHGTALHLRVALDYSARHAIIAAVDATRQATTLTPDDFSRLLAPDTSHPDVDLLIRTSGEQRLSDFLLWECAYAELLFTERLWPDFDATDLSEAVDAYRKRDRRFGRLSSHAA